MRNFINFLKLIRLNNSNSIQFPAIGSTSASAAPPEVKPEVRPEVSKLRSQQSVAWEYHQNPSFTFSIPRWIASGSSRQFQELPLPSGSDPSIGQVRRPPCMALGWYPPFLPHPRGVNYRFINYRSAKSSQLSIFSPKYLRKLAEICINLHQSVDYVYRTFEPTGGVNYQLNRKSGGFFFFPGSPEVELYRDS